MSVVSEAVVKANEDLQGLRNIYIQSGRRGVSERLGLNYNTTGHVLKVLGFYASGLTAEHADVVRKQVQHKDPFHPWTPESSYLLGFILGDGSLRFKGNKYNLGVFSSNLQIIEDLQKIIPVEIVVQQNDSERRSVKSDKPTYSLVTYDYQTCVSVLNLGVVPNKSKVGCNVVIPTQYLASFYRGLFDSDGSVWKANSDIHCHVGCWGHSSYMERLFPCLGLKWHPDHRPNLNGYKLTRFEQVCQFLDWIYSEPGPYLAVKRRVYDEVLGFRQSKQQSIERYGGRSRFGNV